MSSLSRKKFGEGYLFTFLVCIVTAAVLYTPFLIIDKGLFQYCGDFNSQQIPFYTYMNGFVKTAGGQWSWNTDLGTSAINGYSFYLLGSGAEVWRVRPCGIHLSVPLCQNAAGGGDCQRAVCVFRLYGVQHIF